MPPNIEWSVPHVLVSPYGSLLLNELGPLLEDGTTRAVYLLKPKPYAITTRLRKPQEDDLSLADGTSLQPPYVSGQVANLYLEFWAAPNGNRDTATLACGSDLRQMDELLTLHLNALRKQSSDPFNQQRLMWLPSNSDEYEMLTEVMLTEWMTPIWLGDDGAGAGVTFSLGSPYPYAIDETGTEVDIADLSTGTVPNAGTTTYQPRIRVFGPSTEFAITRVDTDEVISWTEYTIPPNPSTGYPGATFDIPDGMWADIDTFGQPGITRSDGVDLVAGLDPLETFMWGVPSGGCDAIVAGADIAFFAHDAFA